MSSYQAGGYITLPVSSIIYNKLSRLFLIGWEKFDENDLLQLSKLDVYLMLIKTCKQFFGNFGNLNKAQRCIKSLLETRSIDYVNKN